MTTIKQLRLAKGWSQQLLAEKARLSMRTVAKADNGIPLNRNTIARLCDVLGANVEDIIEVIYQNKTAVGE